MSWVMIIYALYFPFLTKSFHETYLNLRPQAIFFLQFFEYFYSMRKSVIESRINFRNYGQITSKYLILYLICKIYILKVVLTTFYLVHFTLLRQSKFSNFLFVTLNVNLSSKKMSSSFLVLNNRET